MSTTVRFVGGPRFKEGHAYATPPLAGPFKTRPLIDIYTGKPVKDAAGNPVLETVVGWEVGDEVTFDRALAEYHGRASTTNPKDDGEEWAQLHVDTWNNGYPKGEEPFQIVSKAKASKKPSDESVSVAGGTQASLAEAPPATTPPADAAGKGK